ncbi:hypothetical protein ACFLZ7_01565 [Nanoarchaeota archaeon]
MDDTLVLGGGIELTGFKELDRAQVVVVKKIVGSYARKFSDRSEKFEKLGLTMKKVGNSQFEVHGKLTDNGKVNTSEVTGQNIFVVMDSVLKKLENQK